MHKPIFPEEIAKAIERGVDYVIQAAPATIVRETLIKQMRSHYTNGYTNGYRNGYKQGLRAKIPTDTAE